MACAGSATPVASVIHAKGVYYEWVRTLEAARAFEAANPELAEPPGFCL